MNKPETSARPATSVWPIWLVLLAAGGAFALTMGVRQTMGLFLSALNTSTALGIGSISLAFAFGQLWWGLTQPFAGAVVDSSGSGAGQWTVSQEIKNQAAPDSLPKT